MPGGYSLNTKISAIVKTIRKQAKLVDAPLSTPALWRGPIRREYHKNKSYPTDNLAYQRVFNSLVNDYMHRDGDYVKLLKALHFNLTGIGEFRREGVKIGRFRDFPHSSTIVERLEETFYQVEHGGNEPEYDGAFIHLTLLDIHPFADGNGRIARLMSSLLLLKAGFKSILFTAVEQHFHHSSRQYLSVLKDYRLGKSDKLETISHFLSAMQYSSQWMYWLKRRKTLLLEKIPGDRLLEFERSTSPSAYGIGLSPLAYLRPHLPVGDMKFQLEQTIS